MTPLTPPRLPHVRYRAAEGRFEARLQVRGNRLVAYGPSEQAASNAWIRLWFELQGGPPPQSEISEPSDAPGTIGELLDRWLAEYVALHLAGRTYETYEGIVRLYLRPNFGAFALGDLKAAHIQRYINEMIHDDLPTTSIARHKTTLQSALRWAVRPMGWLPQVPMASVVAPTPRPGVSAHNPRQRSPDVEIPNADEVRLFLNKTKGTALHAMWYAGFTLGLRPSELVALTEDELIRGPSGKVEKVKVFRKAYYAREREPNTLRRTFVTEEPKRASYRTLDAPRSTLKVLLDQAEIVRQIRKKDRKWSHRWDGWLFRRPEGDGEPYDPVAIPYQLKMACELAGVPRWKPSTMRHFCASQLLEAGLPSIRVAQWLGHRDTNMVDRTYGHVLDHVRGQETTGAVMERMILG